MRREESKEHIRRYSNGLWGMVKLEYIDKMIDQIFNDHEAQLKKLKDENLAETEIFNKVVKAKDEEIKELHSHLETIDKDYSAVASDFASAVIEIERLKDDVGIMQHIVSNYKLQANKARSIVAMLFWEWKKRKRLYIANGHRSSNAGWGLYEQTSSMEIVFREAYKMLKVNK